ncbi:MAG: type II toxin-antitoxin system VapC family toxin [Nitrospira sp.]|nr:type II toxin-antitoxin system VapC family toxin [Nitrospira sp.]
MVRFVLDTNVILYLLGGRLAEPLPAGLYAISVISELELLAYPGLVPSEEQRVRAFLNDVTVTELTQAIKNHAVDLRKRYSLKLPDAIVAATALALDATLLTNDQRLLALTEVPTRMLPIKVLS